MTQTRAQNPDVATPTPAVAPRRAARAQDASPATEVRPALPPIPRGGGRVQVDRDGDRSTYTFTEVPPQFMRVAHQAQQTAFGLLGLLGAIIILGPFARMLARRMERKGDQKTVNAAGINAQLLQQQLHELQQSVDAMSVEVERISESQRFQSKLLHEKQSV